MPTSRNRKKKKKNIGKQSDHIPHFSENAIARPGIAPDPITMNYYEVETNGFSILSFEERLEAIRNMGTKAATDFPKKYNALQDWFQRFDQLYILGFTFYYFMTAPAGYDEEAVTGGLEFPPHYQELLQAFALTVPRNYDPHPFAHEVEKFKKDFAEIGELIKLRHFNVPDQVKTPEALATHQIRIEMMMHTIAVRNWSYEHKMSEVTLALAAGIRESFLQIHGFDPEVFLKVLYIMTEKIQERLNGHRQLTIHMLRGKTYNQVMDIYESLFPVIKMPADKRTFLWNKLNRNLQELKFMFVTHSDLFLPQLLSFDFKNIATLADNKLTFEQVKVIMDKISIDFGELADHNYEHFLLNNPIHERPFIRTNENEVFSSLWTTMTDLSIGLLEKFCLEDEKLRKKYNEVRAKYLEEEIVKLFRQSFPMAEIFPGSMWPGEDGRLYENDLLVTIDSFAIIIEAKSGQVTASAKRGAPDRLNKTLRDLIEEPSEQALRFIDYLKRNSSVLSLPVKKGPNNNIDASKLKYFIPLGVTLSHLHTMSSNLKLMIHAGVTDKTIEELAPSINLTDLQIIFDLLPLAAEKIHYLQRRREIEANINYMGDELDLLAWYFDKGFNFGPEEKKYGLFEVSSKSKELNNYIIGSANNEQVKKPGLKMSQWWRDMLTGMETRRPQSWLENSYILLNIPIEGQEIFQQQVADLKKKILKGKAEFVHNWILMGSAEEERQFAVAGYCYQDKYFDDRNAIMGDILDDKRIANTKGSLVIGINIEKNHYPYSVLACKLSTTLFDNKFLRMTNNTEADTPSE